MADDWFTDAVATASRESVVRRIPRREQPRHWCWLIFSPGSLLETWTLMSTKFAPATCNLGLWSCCRLNLHSPHLFNLCVLYISSKLNPAVMIIIKKLYFERCSTSCFWQCTLYSVPCTYTWTFWECKKVLNCICSYCSVLIRIENLKSCVCASYRSPWRHTMVTQLWHLLVICPLTFMFYLNLQLLWIKRKYSAGFKSCL